jgi:glutamate/tyrosine decarboxylase-like PLP-dependent enzyme
MPEPDSPGARAGARDRFAWHPEPELIGIADPAVSREALRAAGAAAWETALDYLYDHALARAFSDPADYDELRALYFAPSGRPGPAPEDPARLEAVLAEFDERIAPHTVSAYHPRSFGYFTPPPLVASITGELLGQFAQQGIDIWHAGPIGAFVEEEVVRWLCDLIGYGEGSFGILTSGGVMANFIGMTLARDVHLARLRGAGQPPRGGALELARVYTSDQTHFSIGRALDELGFPRDTLVVVPADDDFRLRGEAVATAVARDRAAGLLPFAIAAVAGGTNTGSVDAVGELAGVAQHEDLWLHVDAAYGAAARLSARDAFRVPDLDRAASVTVDPHKWFFQGYDIGGLVVREASGLEIAFGGRTPEYYRGGERTAVARAEADRAASDSDGGHDDAAQLNFWKLGFEGSRRWRALKLWLSWKHLGTRGFGKLVEANIDLAAHLARRIAESDDFEALPASPPLSVVCFRHLPGGRDAAGALDHHALDQHQDRLQRALEHSGEGWLSTTRLRGATWLRAGILNTQSTEADVDELLDLLRRLASGL